MGIGAFLSVVLFFESEGEDSKSWVINYCLT